MTKETDDVVWEAKALMSGRLKEDSEGKLNLARSEDPPLEERNLDSPTPITSMVRKPRIDFLKDDPSEMTWGRRIARDLIHEKWYNPRAGQPEPPERSHSARETDPEITEMHQPSLSKAWAYFEHVALSRHFAEPKEKKTTNICLKILHKFSKGDKKLDMAEPGETESRTRLYDPIFTPHKQLGDFGLGIGLYFSTLRALCFITFIAGLINLYNIMYFASDEYMPSELRDELPSLLQGSAICLDTQWVPCPDCNCTEENDREWPQNRCGVGLNNGQNLTFVLKNLCNGQKWEIGMVNYATMILVLFCTMGLGFYLRYQEIKFDEDEQTAQDYSILITNPPPDACDPEEWRKFMHDNLDAAHVTVCTCAVDNDLLVKTLVERRELLRMIENMLKPGTSTNVINLAKTAAEEERQRKGFKRLLAMVSPGIPELFARVVALNAKVQGLCQLEYPVTNVFLSFETEKDQRYVLSKLCVGSLKSARNNKEALEDPKYLFRGETVLAISEPDEPNTIRWQDLNAKFFEKFKQQFFTITCTLGSIALVAFIVYLADDASTIGAAITISVFNSIFPMFAKALTGLEAHGTEGSKQTSMYFKIAAFRWVTTAIVITIITPFTNTLVGEGGLILQIYTIFFSELATTNLIQLADPVGHLQRHFLAPRATTQDAMNLNFRGATFELAERYTNMTKILFLCLWYCSIYPAAFFMCAFTLGLNYFTDRFSLMRTWKRPAHLGTQISRFSRVYFFSVAVLAMAVISSYYWSGFPYDNTCPNDNDVDELYVGNYTVTARSGTGTRQVDDVEISAETTEYRYCLQDLIRPETGISFPFIPEQQPKGDEWMTADQEVVTTIFGWTSVVVILFVVTKFLFGWLQMCQGLFSSSYSAIGEDQGIHFSDVDAISAYIPQVESNIFSYPLLACKTADLDEQLYDWSDPDRPYAYYDLTKDVEKLLQGMPLQAEYGFSMVKHWPPKKVLKDPEAK